MKFTTSGTNNTRITLTILPLRKAKFIRIAKTPQYGNAIGYKLLTWLISNGNNTMLITNKGSIFFKKFFIICRLNE